MQETKLDPRYGRERNGPGSGGRRGLANPPGPPLAQAEDDWALTPRNSACPCGSGKKYKHCHGAIETTRV